MERSVAWRLVYVRRLLDSARAALQSAGPFAPAQAVSSAQDAVELVLALAASYVGVSVGDKDGFVTLLDKVAPRHQPAAAHSRDLHALNKLRVAAKHAGVCPARNEAEHYVATAATASHEILRAEPISIDLERVHRASWLPNQLVSVPLGRAEAMLDDWERADTNAFLEEIAKAVHFAGREADVEAAELVPPAELPLHKLRDARDFAGREVLQTLVKAIDARLSRVEETVADLAIGRPLHELRMLRSVLPGLSYAQNGKLYSSHGIQGPIDAHRAQTIYETAMRVAEHAASVQPRAPLGVTVVATKEAEAWFGSGEHRLLVGSLRIGQRYSFVHRHDEGRISIRLFGVLATIAADAVITASYDP